MRREEEIAQCLRLRENASKEIVSRRPAMKYGDLAPGTVKKYLQYIAQCERRILQCNETLQRLNYEPPKIGD
jgi:hypothetical protein